MTEEAHLRRVPRQTRGQQRVARILSAAAQLFAEVGFEAATTNAIAARAETSIGSLYQFFPNKEAILDALSKQYKEELRDLFEHGFHPNPNADMDTMFGMVAQMTAEFYAARPGFQVVFYGSHITEPLAEAADELYQAIIARIDSLMAFHLPDLDPGQRMLSAAISVKTVKSLLPLAVNNDGSINQVILDEIKLLVASYLRARAQQPEVT
ncbi:MAG: TetR/AcrR family transcriptional regulator [bacterium]|nr:TetR/AcrR family transcriptional regulator [bacterium]